MKNLILTLTILTLTITCYSQKKDTAVKYDTVQTGYVVQITLDSPQYRYIMNYIGQQPIGDERVQGVYTLLSGALKNIRYQPILSLKPKKIK